MFLVNLPARKKAELEGEFVDRFKSNGTGPDLRLLTQYDDSPAPPSGPQAVVNLAHFRLSGVGFFVASNTLWPGCERITHLGKATGCSSSYILSSFVY